MNFLTWYNEVADMPELVGGRWVDLETGIPYGDAAAMAAKKRPAPAPALIIAGKPATVAAGLEYARRLVKGQAGALEKARALPQSAARDAYIIAASAAISAISALTDKPKKAAIAAAIRLNQAASRASNELAR